MEVIRIGIDLGTTNTLACYMKGGKPMMIKFPPSGDLLPSVLYLGADKKINIGSAAKNMGGGDPRNCIRSSKTYMGDFSKEWVLRGRKFTPTDVAAEILKTVRARVIKQLKADENVEIEAVITVPAYFRSNQFDETKKAGERAGFKVLRIITEPLAAAIANIKELSLEEEKIFVVDLGGGTFDVSLLSANGERYDVIDVDGDRQLGGDNFDERLTDYIRRYVEEDLGIDLRTPDASGLEYSDYYSAMWRIREAAVAAKIELSEELVSDIEIPNLFPYKDDWYSPEELSVTREQFCEMCADLFQKVRERVEKVLKKNNIRVDEIQHVILAGGSCYMPKIQEDMSDVFGFVPESALDPSSMVAVGAGFIAGAWDTVSSVIGHDIISHSLGIETKRKDGKLVLTKLLHKGSPYPDAKKEIFTTTVDNQPSVPITIYEAGSDMEDHEEIFVQDAAGKEVPVHDLYGSFELDGIQKAPAGVPQIQVTFSYDESRVLTVTAHDLITGSRKDVVVRKGQRQSGASTHQASIDFMLLMDTSGSMYGQKMRDAKKAASTLINNIIDLSVHRLGVIGFGTRAERLHNLSQDKQSLLASTQRLNADGGTAMDQAIAKGISSFQDSSRRRVLLIVTDGDPNSRSDTDAEAARAKRASIDIITIGIGIGGTWSSCAIYLRSLASRPEFSYTISSMSQLADMFKTAIENYITLRN